MKQNYILRLPEVLKRTGLSRTTLYTLISKGEFPPNIAITQRCVGWDSQAVDDWVQRKLASLNCLKGAGK